MAATNAHNVVVVIPTHTIKTHKGEEERIYKKRETIKINNYDHHHSSTVTSQTAGGGGETKNSNVFAMFVVY